MKTCDKNLFPELPSILNTDRNKIDRLICIGDIHGDLDLAIQYLEIPKLIKRVYEENEMTVTLWYKDEFIKRIYEWTGRRTIAIQVGDQIDRCRPYNGKNCFEPDATIDDESSDLTIMFFYNDLHLVARKVDCALFSLLGNHELLNVLGNMQYVSYKGLKEFPTTYDENQTLPQESIHENLFKGRIQTFSLLSKDKKYRKKSTIAEFLGCSRLTSMIIDGYLFVHAGIMEKLIDYVKKKDNKNIIPTLNQMVKMWLLNAYDDKDKKYVEPLVLGDDLSPFWPRVFGNMIQNLDIQTPECKKIIQPIIQALSIKGIVVGHTPQIKTNINSTCSNTIWRIDVASSKAFDEVIFDGVKDNEKQQIQKGRKPQVLEIILNKEKDIFNILINE